MVISKWPQFQKTTFYSFFYFQILSAEKWPFQSKQRITPAWILLTNSEDEAFSHVTKLKACFESNSKFDSFLQKQGDVAFSKYPIQLAIACSM